MRIVVRLNGGLGNQMFQYALGRAVGLKLNAEVSYDLAFFAQAPGIHVPRELGLAAFGIGPQAASEELVRVARHGGSSRRARWARLLPSFFPERVYAEKADFVFDPGVFGVRTDTYFDGYWQSERYFAECIPALRTDLTFRKPLSPPNAAHAEAISNCEAVSVHVRRGDYVTHAGASSYLGIARPDYYRRALERMEQRVPQARYFVFSDDPVAARAELSLPPGTVFVDNGSTVSDHEDMHLMSLCKHHIIANSSFSWWGAWLNASPDKIVIGPERWLRDPARSTPDLLPSSWIRT